MTDKTRLPYERIADEIQSRIRSGEQGSPLPTAELMAAQFGALPTVVRAAYKTLADRGVIVREGGLWRVPAVPPKDIPDRPWAVWILRPDLPDVQIGPLTYQYQASDQAATLEMMMHSTHHVDGTVLAVGRFRSEQPHLGAVPTGAEQLALLIQGWSGSDGTGRDFPDIYSRLQAQVGLDRASEVWLAAAALVDDEPAEPEPEPAHLIDRWNELDDGQRGNVIGFLARSRTSVLLEALDSEGGARR